MSLSPTKVRECLSLQGKKVKDRVTGLEGVVTSISFDLFGCCMAALHPGLDKEQKPRETNWYDVNRLAILDDTPVMDVPVYDFAASQYPKASTGRELHAHGPADKPAAKQ